MPYNNTPIAPPSEFTGQVSLPLARVKKIIATDDDVAQCSNNAAFVITVATEMFVQYLVERTHDVVKSERKVRRNIQYRDVANAVARIDNLEFLSDCVPRTQRYKEFKKTQAARNPQQSQQQVLQPVRPVTRDGDVQMGGVVPEHQTSPIQTLPYQPISPAQQRTPQQSHVMLPPQSPYSVQPNGTPVLVQSPVLTNGHAPSHSRSHSLEHLGVLHPQPLPQPPMQ